MVGNYAGEQEALFTYGGPAEMIPADHRLRQVAAVLDLGWVADEVASTYTAQRGAPSYAPETIVRLLLASYLLGLHGMRQTCAFAETDAAIRWFIGCWWPQRVPDHSTISKTLRRWGPEVFARVFERSVGQAVASGLVGGRLLHVDATVMRANVDRARVEWVEETWAEVAAEAPVPAAGPPGLAVEPAAAPPPVAAPARPTRRKLSRTDPDATLAKSSQTHCLEPAYKAHLAVDDASGVVVDVTLTTGEVSEGRELLGHLDRAEALTGARYTAVTGDKQYGRAENYDALTARGCAAILVPPGVGGKQVRYPLRRFAYDALHDLVKCPRGKTLRRCGEGREGVTYRARVGDCGSCPLAQYCLSAKAKVRSVRLVSGYLELLRARRRKERGWSLAWREAYTRHRWRVEGKHAEAKREHGLGRARGRGLANVKIQVYLTAALLNLKLLARQWAEAQRQRQTAKSAALAARLGAVRARRSPVGARGDVRRPRRAARGRGQGPAAAIGR